MRVVTPVAVEQTPSRVILRDGTTAIVRLASRDDRDDLRRFFHGLSPESRRRRFFSFADPSDVLLDSFCDSSDPSRRATVIAWRQLEGALRPIAVGSYVDLGNGAAEAAFAVADRFQGKGLGTILLERLATLASANGFRRFEALVLSENAAMLEVFHESGFEIRSKSDGGCLTVLLSLSPTSESVAAAERRPATATVAPLQPPMRPRSIAVIGASRDPARIGNRVLKAIVGAAFPGPIYPINPKAHELDGLACYRSIGAAPRGVDLAIVAVPARAVIDVVGECAAAGVKSLVVITAGFAEVGGEGRALEQRLLDAVPAHGMRM